MRDKIKIRVRHQRKVKRVTEQMRSRGNFIPVENINEYDNSEYDELSASDKLKTWAIEYNISQRAISALSKILISIGISWLPSDSRALLKTPRIIRLENCTGGKLWYRGIGNNFKSIFKHSNEIISISLNFNFDGTVLFNSSSWNFWPILANIYGKYSISFKI